MAPLLLPAPRGGILERDVLTSPWAGVGGDKVPLGPTRTRHRDPRSPRPTPPYSKSTLLASVPLTHRAPPGDLLASMSAGLDIDGEKIARKSEGIERSWFYVLD